MARGTPRRSPLISVTGAAAIATSVPVPIARPTSACARAGASFIPSPTIATIWPLSCNFLTSADFPSGKISASTWSTPTCLPIASAVRLVIARNHHYLKTHAMQFINGLL